MEIKNIAVFGTGLMGKGIIQVLAGIDYRVYVFSRSIDSEDRFKKYLQYELNKGRFQESFINTIFKNIEFFNYGEFKKLSDADLVIESTKEDKELKKNLLCEISGYCKPDTIFVTNTSTFSVTELSSSIKKQSKFCGMHFFSPVPMMPLVEVIRGLCTDDETINKVFKLAEDIGKIPVIVKDTPGFILNRLMAPYIKEAVCLLEEGVTSAEEIDKIVTLGMNLKVGPLKLADLIGLDVIKVCMENLYCEYKESRFNSILLNNMVRAGMIGRKAGAGFYNYNG